MSRYGNPAQLQLLAGPVTAQFVIPGNSDEYLDPAHTMLSLRVSIKSSTSEEDVAEADRAAYRLLTARVGPVNNIMHSLFNQVDVFFNRKPVSPPTNVYVYRAYIETLLNYRPAAKTSHLSTVLWCNDTAGKMNNTENLNEGFVERRNLLAANKPVNLVGHLHTDVFNQEKLLLNGVEVREANLLGRRVKISPSILLAHAQSLSRATAKYPLTRVEVKAVSMHSGVHGETLDNIILGQLPKRIILGFVNNKAFNGDRLLNPFNFEHFNINFLCLYVDRVQMPSKPLQPDFTTKNIYVNAYHTLFGTGIHFLNKGNQVTRENYPHGYCLFAFDLTDRFIGK
ncbi:uncharacterized protein F54H12.2-like [Nasonia vitripennis]|uniref:Uncharacterized protein n=1 Tax=Nasonia vitripennis TaxID=7425 RepID=A0A7M7QBH4_NASVI|nr:uncharacterized protein F54H12.2-like [Nasonia vitripennis]